jgi:hypothetical protein
MTQTFSPPRRRGSMLTMHRRRWMPAPGLLPAGTSFARMATGICVASLVLSIAIEAQGRGRGPQPDDNTGFVSIFDGRTLNNWDGDSTFWRAENGMIIAESTPAKRVTVNTFLIWRGGTTADFELKLDYRMTATANSGVQYRSAILSNVGKWVMKGYQADLDGVDRYSGQIYEERGRAFLATRGSFTRIGGTAGGGNKLIGSLGDDASLKALLKPNDWNSLHIIARGNTIIQMVNGRMMSALIDEDEQGRAMEGLLGLQIHTGEPMKIEFRNLMFKKL